MRLSHLGDLVHALPVFHALRAVHPSAELGWVVQPEFAGLLEGLPGLSRIFRFDRRGGALAWPRLAAELATFGPDLAVDVQANSKSALVALASGAPRRFGPARADWREPFGAHVLTEAAPPLEGRGPTHALQRMEHLARHLGACGPLRFDADLSPAELAGGEAELDAHLPSGEPPVLLVLSRPGDPRSWPATHWIELARGLARGGGNVLVLAGPAEAELGRAVARALAGEAVAQRGAPGGLRPLAALFTAAARRGGLLVACDTGPMHLAAASGLAVLALAGPQDPDRTGPWPRPGAASPHRVLRALRPPPCMPCLARRCAHPLGAVCMERVAPAQVLAAIRTWPLHSPALEPGS